MSNIIDSNDKDALATAIRTLQTNPKMRNMGFAQSLVHQYIRSKGHGLMPYDLARPLSPKQKAWAIKLANGCLNNPVKEVKVDNTLQEQINKLRNDMTHNSFAQSLVKQFDSRGSLSPKQKDWVVKLVNEIGKPKAPKANKFTMQDFTSIVTLFKNALSKLKRPKITFVNNGTAFALKPSKDLQWVHVSAPEYGGNYYGKISVQDGTWVDGRNINQEVADFLNDFAKDPVAKSQEYGKRSGVCCFCHKCLDREESLEVGYGPVCAKNWGLPHSYRSNGKAVQGLYSR